jgi:hypothetical protein
MAAINPAVVASWWTLVPFNIATRLSGVVAIDVDDDASLSALAPYGPWPITPTQRTGRGWHFFFRVPQDGFPTLDCPIKGARIETKAEGASLTLAPSRHQSGRYYTWVPGRDPFTCALADVPPAFLAHLQTVAGRLARGKARQSHWARLDPTDVAAVAALLQDRAGRAGTASNGHARQWYCVRRTLEDAGASAGIIKATERVWRQLNGRNAA